MTTNEVTKSVLMKKIILDGNSLSIEQVIKVAFHNYQVSIHPNAIQNVKASQYFIHHQVKAGKIVYGVTTGFGPNADKRIKSKDAETLQHNLLISHCTGVGRPFSEAIVRAIMVIRMNTVLAGHSGIRLNTIKLMMQFLNNNIHPYVPEQGSVGASGDLAPLCHLAVPLIGIGKVFYENELLTLPELYEKPAIKALNQDIEKHNTDNQLQLEDNDYIMPIQKWKLSHKESLAMINGTTVMNALGVIGVYKAKRLLQGSLKSATMFMEALGARHQAFDKVIHTVRRHSGQQTIAQHIRDYYQGSSLIGISPLRMISAIPIEVLEIQNFEPLQAFVKERIELVEAANLAELEEELANLKAIFECENSEELFQPAFLKTLMETVPRAFCNFLINNLKKETTVDWKTWRSFINIAKKKVSPQDSYSVRCMPQVFGASLQAIRHVEQVVETELNAVVDNPIIFIQGQELYNGHQIQRSRVLSGGNFHGQPLALVLDYLKLAVAEMGNLLERQVCKLTDRSQNYGLPAFLVEEPGLNSGMMIMQYSAAALVSENKVLVHPASADSIPTSANQEDHVSMGPIAGRQALEIIGNVEKILAYHLITSKQALDMRIRQFSGRITISISKSSQELVEQLEELGIVYYDKDRYMHDDIISVKDGLEDIYENTMKL